MLKQHNPATVPPAFSRYSQAVEAPQGYRWLYLSGQVGVGADGKLGSGFSGQAEIAWRNILALLEAAGMGVEDLVKINLYLTRASDLGVCREMRDRFMGEKRAASTLVVVVALADPELLIEIEAIAAKAP